ncbi:hypothetical protein ACGFZJ_38030 [Streptomyces sp. NPDC048253]|uniref:hypothetical protein n=1 Tax=Streptomyces sp. NPDC048253 TaxID=3365524 RepID=UPI0037210F6B
MRNRLAIISAAVVLPLTAVASLAAATQAGADPKSGTVVVTGQVEDCPNGASPNKVTISTDQESRVDNKDVDTTGQFAIKFTNIAKTGSQTKKVTVNCGSATSYTADNFKISRPAGTDEFTVEHDIETP